MELLCLAELQAGLSMVADIGMGFEPGEAGRAVLVAMELCDLRGEADACDVYSTTMLQHVGCTAYAHEAAAMLGGDEIAVKRAAMVTDWGRVKDVTRTYLPGLAPTAGFATRLRAAGTAAARSKQIVRGYSQSNCEVAARTAERVGLGAGVRAGLLHVYEQWNGKGGPNGIAGESIPLTARIAQVALTISLFHAPGRARRGG